MPNYEVDPFNTVSLIKVTAIFGEWATYTVTWPLQPGATGYNVLGSPSPLVMNAIQSGQNLSALTSSFEISLPLVPQDVVFHFWVQAIYPGPTLTLIQSTPATLFDNVDPFNPDVTSGSTDSSNPAQGSCIIGCGDEQNLPVEMMAYYRDEIRRRSTSILNNDGEDFFLHLRRWSGVPCKCVVGETTSFEFSSTAVYQVLSSGEQVMVPPATIVGNITASSTGPLTVDSTLNFTSSGYIRIDNEIIAYSGKTATEFTGLTRGSGSPTTVAMPHTVASSLDPNLDPGYNVASGRCELCYGTGIAGGYWPAIDIRVRYGESPARTIAFVNRAAEMQHSFPSWTLWLPRLHEHDLLVRKLTGERFEVVGISESRWRGSPLSQRFSTNKMQGGDIRYKVTDTGIQAGLDAAYTDDPVKFDMTIFS